jgi:hypothetical protein
MLNTLIEEPKRPTARTLIVDPRWVMSYADTLLPTRANERTEIVLPRASQSSKLIAEPMSTLEKRDI